MGFKYSSFNCLNFYPYHYFQNHPFTVPEKVPSTVVSSHNASKLSTLTTLSTVSTVRPTNALLRTNKQVMDIMCPVLQYCVLGIAGVFMLEVSMELF